jgi:hypothetical protein
MSIGEKFVSAVKVAAQVTPLTAMMSQALDEIDSARVKARLDRLEDPLAQYGPRTKNLMTQLYSKVKAQGCATTRIEWDPVFAPFRKELRQLEAAGFLEGRHAVTGEFAEGLRLSNPGFIIDLALLFDDPAKSAKLNEIIDGAKQRLSGRELAVAIGLPLTVINAFFQQYQRLGLGITSAAIGEFHYIPRESDYEGNRSAP